MPVTKRLGYSGPAAVFVTTTILDWRPILADTVCARIAALELYQTATVYDCGIMAYVIMPSHVHFIVGLQDYQRLSAFMKCYKGVVSRALRTKLAVPDISVDGEKPCRLWMRRFDDLILITEKQFAIKLNYIHNNPVRAFLCASPTEWEYSSACVWLQGKPGMIPIQKHWEWLKE